MKNIHSIFIIKNIRRIRCCVKNWHISNRQRIFGQFIHKSTIKYLRVTLLLLFWMFNVCAKDLHSVMKFARSAEGFCELGTNHCGSWQPINNKESMESPSQDEQLLSGLRDSSLRFVDTTERIEADCFDFSEIGPYAQNQKEFILQELRELILEWATVRKEPDDCLHFVESFSEMDGSEISRRGILFAHGNSWDSFFEQLAHHEGLSDALLAAKSVDHMETYILKRYCVQVKEETKKITIHILDLNKYINRQVHEWSSGHTSEYQLTLTAYEYSYE